MGYEYVAVPWPADAADPQPEMREALESIGFRLLGGCALTDAAQRDVRRTAASYGVRGREFEHWAAQPGQVLTAPDHTAFAQLAWLWECRYATFTTVLADGRVLQTMTEWGADPVWPTALASHYRTTDRHTEQLVLATDPQAQVVAGAQDAWETHCRRVSATAAAVPQHTELADFVAIWSAESRARSTWTTRVQVVAGLLAFALVAVPFFVVSTLLGRQPWWIDAVVVVSAGVCVLPVFGRLWLRTRRWRRLRPTFRAPVPGART